MRAVAHGMGRIYPAQVDEGWTDAPILCQLSGKLVQVLFHADLEGSGSWVSCNRVDHEERTERCSGGGRDHAEGVALALSSEHDRHVAPVIKGCWDDRA